MNAVMFFIDKTGYSNSIVIYQREEVELPCDALLEDNAKCKDIC